MKKGLILLLVRISRNTDVISLFFALTVDTEGNSDVIIDVFAVTGADFLIPSLQLVS